LLTRRLHTSDCNNIVYHAMLLKAWSFQSLAYNYDFNAISAVRVMM